jgi:hypothetical protein
MYVYMKDLYKHFVLTTTAKEMMLKFHDAVEWSFRTMEFERTGTEEVCNPQSFSAIFFKSEVTVAVVGRISTITPVTIILQGRN